MRCAFRSLAGLIALAFKLICAVAIAGGRALQEFPSATVVLRRNRTGS
jgi:hypothetical protein